MPSDAADDVPSLSQIRAAISEKFGYRACLWQLQVVQALLRGDKDVVCIAGTGSGKTLTFWMPLVFKPKGLQIIVTPLNILGDQNTGGLKKLGISGIALNKETATARNLQDVEDGKYSVVTVNPEILNSRFDRLWKNETFTSRIISMVWDEAHCVSTWGDFREQYKESHRLRYIIPQTIPFYLPSATLPEIVLKDVMSILQIRQDKLCIIQRPNDRPNIRIAVSKMKHPANSFRDLDFLIPNSQPPEEPHKKFLVFFDSIAESLKATKYLQARLSEVHGRDHVGKVAWFNSDMSDSYRRDYAKELRMGEVWGLICTDSFGMGMDLPDIDTIVQWKATCTMCALWQRFGRGARDFRRTAFALFLVEPKHFDGEKEKAAKAKARREANKKRKAIAHQDSNQTKKTRTSNSPASSVVPTSTHNPAPRVPVMLPESDAQPCAVETVESADADGENDENANDGGYEELREVYERAEMCGTTGKRTRTIEPAMQDMINASTRTFKCFRIPVKVYFRNDKLESDHNACDPSLPTGCTRCASIPPPVCCNLCHPDAFPPFDSPTPSAPPAPRRSALKDYKLDSTDSKLRQALHDLRMKRAEELYGPAVVRDLGPGCFMPDSILKRIIDCAHYSKVTTTKELATETRWTLAEQYGHDVLAVINAARPVLQQSPFTSEPKGQISSSRDRPPPSSGTPSAPARQPRQCRACGATDHIASNRRCPKHGVTSSSPAISGDENRHPGPMEYSRLSGRVQSTSISQCPAPPICPYPMPIINSPPSNFFPGYAMYNLPSLSHHYPPARASPLRASQIAPNFFYGYTSPAGPSTPRTMDRT
ncbi:P-loop containing nucleoside triphosphate hydrolase protein [Gloeophyllum trabeum ATCC 11539]|uniref:DNA 3'-5' helicase n=1 Tax=Gloeophyllum trabeum (strain ATCC 11539 / FP-39264 / Madison 617) TaxID=670483 RepID=S7PQG8_GLOTA|nr:P-loop containing nucleoside triphosphate hydrolase protein [Gloeophyllum trabeum ATCC 11539]EPQ50051.1 P-loop containing nucleoside triphosphate hydrolase protein [Gloeophyllum trabeum ATCC 11539]